MENNINSEFNATINGINFEDQNIYKITAYVIRAIENVKGININDDKFTNDLKEEFKYSLSEDESDIFSVGLNTSKLMTSEPTLTDFKIAYRNKELQKESLVNQNAKAGKYDYLLENSKSLEQIDFEKYKFEQKFWKSNGFNPDLPLHKKMVNQTTYFVERSQQDKQYTLFNKNNEVRRISFDSDVSYEQGLKRAEHYNQWARESENLDGHRTGVTADTIKPETLATINSDEYLQGYLPVGSIYWDTSKELAHVFPTADDATLKKQLEPIRNNAERLLYSVKEDAIVNPSNDAIKIPVDVWTQGKPDGFTQSATGDLEHVGGYIAKMANVTPEDAKQLLTPKQLEQYNDITKSIDKSQGKEVTTEEKISKRGRERGSGLGR